MAAARVHGTDCNGVEQAEAHRPVRLGVMARRAHCGKGGVCLVLGYQIDRPDHRTRRAQCRFHAAGTEHGVGIERGMFAFAHMQCQ